MADAAIKSTGIGEGWMSEEQKAAHLRLLAILPVRTVAEEVENWPESDRELSEEELPYLLAGEA